MNSAYSRLKQIYLGIIPAYPLGYVFVHGFRGDQIWAKPYMDRSNLEPSEHLKELVESEIDKMDGLKKAKYTVALTDEMEPKVYGGLFLSCGAELQFPLRMSLDDVETARRIGANLEVDMGLSKHRRKVEVASETGDELITRLMISDSAKRFLVQRQLLIANRGEEYAIGAIDYLDSTMKLNRLYRKVLGEEGDRRIARNGDVIDDVLKLSVRIREIRKIRKEQQDNGKIADDDV
uniref:Uncharacterized protein n=2 Tax=Caenorhabditis japonica TaxID=281687 RepID=A0A8R1DGU2_CAEJA